MIEQHAKALLDVIEGGEATKEARHRIITASLFGAGAYENAPVGDAAPLAFVAAFLKAMIDHLDPDLDVLRADPAAGAAARAARKGGAA